MAYRIVETSLKHDGTGKISHGPVGEAEDLEDAAQFIDGWKYKKHDTPLLLLSRSLSERLAAWQVLFDKQATQEQKEFLARMFNLVGSLVVGNGGGVLKQTGGMYVDMFKAMQKQSKEPVYLTLVSHYQQQYNAGQTGVCLCCDRKGSDYGIGARGLQVYEHLRGRRLV